MAFIYFGIISVKGDKIQYESVFRLLFLMRSIMNGFRSACIINKPKENVKAAKIQGFFKWIGISYVTLISKEDNVCHDPVLKENRECLDVTVYLKE